MRLARDVVAIYYSEAEAEAAQQAFVRVFQKGDLPEEMPAYRLQPGETVLDVLLAASLVSSKGEGRRLLSQNGVRLDGETITDGNGEFPHAGVLQVGKRRFLRVTA
jgi:tyrosyl-tRNA synthetase